MDNIVTDLESFATNFHQKFSNQCEPDIEQMWAEFKDAISDTMVKNIPSKTISGNKHSLLWITSNVKKAIRKRDALFAKQKKTNSPLDEAAYKTQKQKAQSLLRKSYWSSIEGIFTENPYDKPATQKKFWKFVKATKKDRTGTAP